MLSAHCRSISELESCAQRLHAVDPGATEPIPVSPEEAYAIQEHAIKTKPYAIAGMSSLFDLHLGGHKLKIL